MPSTLSWSSLALAVLAGTLLLSCSSADSTPETKPGASTKAAVPFPFGTKVDSLNGIAGHTFGQPLSAFSNMQPLPVEKGELTRVYSPSPDQQSGWFGKHRKQVYVQLYWFQGNKFVKFRAVGVAATLRTEAVYLLGSGLEQGPDQLFWEGSRARAVYSEQNRGFGQEGTLDVLSKPFEAEQAARAQAQLKAENTP
ncbi:MAG: hypothetical protein ACRYG7_11840 [Janthinobacterium lividum]